MKEIKVFITLEKLKIQSINSMYKAGMIYRNGKHVPYIYKSAESKRVADIMTDALRAIDWTEHLEWLKETPQFTVTQNYVFKTGISRRDTGNCEKLISDVFVKFIRNELGIDNFDDSKFTDLHLYKSIIPESEHEYICVSIKPSTFNTRFDLVPKPENIFYQFPLEEGKDLKEIKRLHKERELRFKFQSGETNFRKADHPNTEVIVIDPNSSNFSEDLINLMKKISELGDINFIVPVFLSHFPGLDTIKELKNTLPIVLPKEGDIMEEVLKSL
jgi:hypothetical protein